MVGFLALAVLCSTATPGLEISGVRWYDSLDEAKAVAKKTGKPILHLQMFGKLNDEFC